MSRKITLLLLAFITVFTLHANNIEVNNITLTNQNTGAETTVIQFDLAWENSWRISVGPSNYDAAWVFAKYRVGGGPWRHATLAGPGTIPAGAAIDVEDNAGAFVYRAADGNGDLAFTNVQLVWDYGEDNVDPAAVVDVQVFAVEMVYVPEGEFQLGTGPERSDGSSDEQYEFRQRRQIFGTFTGLFPYPVTSENAIRISDAVGDLYYDAPFSSAGDQSGPVPAAFPKGFAAFYCMKYEISQAQYVAFFNTLTDQQKTEIDITVAKGTDELANRNGVSWPDFGNATTSHPDVACGYLSDDVLYAYLDWSALRPMTELEFEKACRGPVDPVADEFAWGNNSRNTAEYQLTNAGQPNELITNPATGAGNFLDSQGGSDLGGPVRCGIFAASAVNATREETGGTFYGIMELSGNLFERLISIGAPDFRSFEGTHGNGSLTAAGAANVSTWPIGSTRTAFRGGSYLNSSAFMRVSDRSVSVDAATNGNTRLGGRGVRTAN